MPIPEPNILFEMLPDNLGEIMSRLENKSNNEKQTNKRNKKRRNKKKTNNKKN